MKKLLLVLPLLLAFAACKEPDDDDITNGDMSTRYFYAHDTANNDAEYQVTAKQIAVGKYCIMYLETVRNISTDNIKNLAREFDNKIYPIVTENFGSPKDVGGNGKIIILLLDIKDTYTGNKGAGEGYVAGYFWAGNMYSNVRYSNKADMLYVRINPGLNPENLENTYSIMAHEFQHLVNFSVRGGKSEDTWINEGLSTAAEDLYLGKRLSERIVWYNVDPDHTIRQGNTFFIWKGTWEQTDPLSNYATAYLFFQWLRIHASNGSKIYKEIISHQEGDYMAVVDAARKRFNPSIGSWDVLLRTWFAANFYGDSASQYGYKGQITLTPHYFSSSLHALSLDPGEGVYGLLSETKSLPGSGNIQYAGLKTGFPVNTNGTYQNDWVLLTFNANSDNKSGGAESGYVCDTVPAPLLARNGAAVPVQSFEGKPPTLWQWDSIRAATGNAVHSWQDIALPGEFLQERGR